MLAFDVLWKNHPSNQSVEVRSPCLRPDGTSAFANQCAIRMSVCLSRSGVSLVSYKGALCWYDHGRQHAIRAEELAAWLAQQTKLVGRVGVARRTSRASLSDLTYLGRRGIILCRDFWGPAQQGDHIDLWNGRNLAHGAVDYIQRSREVWFWGLR